MNNRISTLVAAAMESVENDMALANAEPVDPAESDAAVAQVDDSHREVEAAMADSETLEEVHEGLEALAATLESLTEPLSPSAATFMNIAAEAHLERVGLDMSDAPIIASFENEAEAEKATKLSLDSVKTKIRAIIAAIQRMWTRVVEAVKGFFKHVMDANHRLEKRAVALEAKLAQVHGDAKEQEVDIGHLLYARLQVGGKIDHETLTHGLANVTALVKGMGGDPGNAVAQSAKLTLDVLHAKDENAVDAIIAKQMGIKFDVPAVFSQKVEKDGRTEHQTVEMPGGVKYSIGLNDKVENNGIEHIRNLFSHVAWDKSIKNPIKVESTKAATLSVDEMRHIVAAAKDIAKQGTGLSAQIDKTTADINALGKQNAEAKAEQVGGAGAKKIADMYGALAKCGQLYMKMVVDAAQYSTSVLGGYLGYAEKSLAQYEAKLSETEQADADKIKENAAIGAAA